MDSSTYSDKDSTISRDEEVSITLLHEDHKDVLQPGNKGSSTSWDEDSLMK